MSLDWLYKARQDVNQKFVQNIHSCHDTVGFFGRVVVLLAANTMQFEGLQLFHNFLPTGLAANTRKQPDAALQGQSSSSKAFWTMFQSAAPWQHMIEARPIERMRFALTLAARTHD